MLSRQYFWRDLLERLGEWKNVHQRFSRWAKSAVWQQVSQHLASDADNEYAMIDSTIVRPSSLVWLFHQACGWRNLCQPHPSAQCQCEKKAGQDQAIGRSRGGLSTKIHTMVDALGSPTGFYLTRGEVHDLAGVDHLLPDMQADMLIADKQVIKPLATAGKTAVIQPQSSCKMPRNFDRDLYKARHLIENFCATSEAVLPQDVGAAILGKPAYHHVG